MKSLSTALSSAVTPLQRWLEPYLRLVVQRLQPVLNVARVLWLAGYCTTFLVVGAAFFLVNDQGLDFLRRMAETPPWYGVFNNVFFFTSVLAWALANWYCTRLLLRQRFPGTTGALFDQTAWLRSWLPVLYGGLAPLILAAGFLRLIIVGGTHWGVYALAIGYLVTAIVLVVIFARRRRPDSEIMQLADPGGATNSLPAGSWRVLAISISLSWSLLVLFLLSPVAVPTALGAPAVLLLAVASWVLFGSMILTYWPRANGYPALTLPLLLLAIGASWLNDNHSIRLTAAKQAAVAREAPAAHFRRWLAASDPPPAADERFPVFVVASAGGGIRAAYWTTLVLGRIADDGDGRWPRHLYAISGVSGGSLGAALHAVQIAGRVDGTPGASFVEQARGSLRHDLLSSPLSALLFGDLVQRFVPYPLPFTDRARAIERAMEAAAAAGDGIDSRRFGDRFVELWSGLSARRVPSLLLNTTVVETGQRAIVSNLRIDDSFTDAVDLLGDDKLTQDMPLSTAAHLSARFTYVSPAATIRRADGRVWGHVVDGGYFENSGSVTAMELIEAIRSPATLDAPAIVPMLILIRNDPESPSLCTNGDVPVAERPPYAGLGDLLSPIRALLNTRVARGRLAERDAVTQMARLQSGGGEPAANACRSGCVFEFSLKAGDIAPPLGWSLSSSSRESIDRQLDLPDNARQFACIRGILSGQGCREAPSCVAPL